jgi:hypothetical protein
MWIIHECFWMFIKSGNNEKIIIPIIVYKIAYFGCQNETQKIFSLFLPIIEHTFGLVVVGSETNTNFIDCKSIFQVEKV